MKNQKSLTRLICLAVVGILITGCYLKKFDGLRKFSLLTEDTKYLIRAGLNKTPQADPATLIVTIDERSINRLGRWPWNRRIMAELISRLSEADIVCLDIIFSEPSEPAADRALTEAIAENGNIITGYFFRPSATQEISPERLDILHDSAYSDLTQLSDIVGVKEFPAVELNIPEIDQAALAHSFFTIEPDPDGLYRRYPLAFAHKGYLYPPLAVQMVRFQQNRQAGIVLDENGIKSFNLGSIHLRENYFGLNFYDPAKARKISAVDLIDGKIPAAALRGTLVLIGITESGVFDLRPTPVDPVIPGVWVHYTALNNLLNNEMLHELPALDYLLTALSLILIFLISRLRVFIHRLGGYLMVIGLILGLANYLHIAHNLWVHEFYPLAGALLLAMALDTTAFFFTEVRAGALKRAFTSYVSPALVDEILANPDSLELGGSEREISILFSDIRGFTSLSEQISPTQLVGMLSRIHDPMTQVILKNKGLLDKYIGDAMMALFNAPVDLADHAGHAVRSALEMEALLAEINADFQGRQLPEINFGVGINTGRCIVGNMGSSVRFNYTAIGDAVNLASRLEGLCKTYHCRIIISEFTAEQLSGDFLLRPLDRVRVKGRHEPVTIFQPLERNAANQQLCTDFAAALKLYRKGDFPGAARIFEILGAGGDPVSSVYLQRCEDFTVTPPSPDWDSVHNLTCK